MKTILLLVHDDSGQEARFQVALDLARTVNGHITCLDLAYFPALVSSGFYDDSYMAAELAAEEVTREAKNRAHLEARLAHEDVSWNWVDATGEPAFRLEKAANLADVIVVNRRLETPALVNMERTAAELIVRSGKPVLAVPADCKRLDLGSALIAWDGSAAATAALRAAIPLLRHTARVELMAVQDGSIATSAEETAIYLSAHDVHVTLKSVGALPGEAGATIMAELEGGRFGYLVMGGYSHPRFVEALFGGVTRTMLAHSPVPLFLAH